MHFLLYFGGTPTVDGFFVFFFFIIKEVINLPKKRPAPHCVICEKSLEATGGKRVYWSALNSVMVNEKSLTCLGTIWNEQTTKRAAELVQQGYLPWFCQRCGNVGLCLHCGNPLTSPPGAEILKDDGTTSHVPVFAGLLPCPTCDRQNERFSFEAT